MVICITEVMIYDNHGRKNQRTAEGNQLCELFDKSMGYVTGQSDIPGHSRIMEEEAVDLALSEVEEELTEYALKFARLDEFGRRAVQSVIREEEARCRAQESFRPAKECSGFISISRKSDYHR